MAFLISFGFGKLSDAELLVFLDKVIQDMKGNATYAAEQDAVEELEIAVEKFREAVAAAKQGGSLLIQERDNQREATLSAAYYLAKMVDMNAKGNVLYILGAAFQPQKTRVRDNTPFPKPSLKFVKRGVKAGTIVGEVNSLPKGVREVCVLHSIDGGKTYTNGAYSGGKKFSIEGLPTKQEVLVSVYFVGTFGRKSDVSDPMTVFVL